MKDKLPPPYGALEGVMAFLQKSDITAAQKAVKKLMMDIADERTARNAELYEKLYKFVNHVMSARGKKAPEEVAILPAVVKLLLKRG